MTISLSSPNLSASVTCLIEDNICEQMDYHSSYEAVDHLKKHYTTKQFNQLSRAVFNQNEKLRICSFNVLFSEGDYRLPHEYRWEKRKVRVIEAIHSCNADILLK